MSLSNLIKLSFFLAFIGVFLAIISISVPWIWSSGISDSRWQAAGQISSAVASIFGMLIASAALFAYLKREEVGQTQADIAYQQKLRLEQAIHQYCFFYERIVRTVSKSIPVNTDSYKNYNFLILPSLSHLQEALSDASKSDLYKALGSIKIKQEDGLETNGGIELIYLHFHIKRMIEAQTINIDDKLLKKNIVNLITALDEISKHNIYNLIHCVLDKAPLEYMVKNKV